MRRRMSEFLYLALSLSLSIEKRRPGVDYMPQLTYRAVGSNPI